LSEGRRQTTATIQSFIGNPAGSQFRKIWAHQPPAIRPGCALKYCCFRIDLLPSLTDYEYCTGLKMKACVKRATNRVMARSSTKTARHHCCVSASWGYSAIAMQMPTPRQDLLSLKNVAETMQFRLMGAIITLPFQRSAATYIAFNSVSRQHNYRLHRQIGTAARSTLLTLKPASR
jgi:hypothetical protein